MNAQNCGRSGARIALASLFLLFGLPAAAHAAPVLPDLVADPPGVDNPKLIDDGQIGGRRLLRFDGWVHNRGPGCVDVMGSNRNGNVMTTVVQRIYDSADCRSHSPAIQIPIPGARIKYQKNDGHNHWHLLGAARYSLWNNAMTRQVARATKVGFCLLDWNNRDQIVPWTAFNQNEIRRCEHDNTSATSVNMGISPGWRDLYQYFLPLQWVDVSNVTPGVYHVAEEVDPDNLIREADENNPLAFSDPVTIPGYVAKSFRRRVKASGSTKIRLRTRKVGSPGKRSFAITKRPKHGKLSRRKGKRFRRAVIKYTPNAGYHGRDSFRYVARDGLFPLRPKKRAIVRIRVP